MMMRKSRILKQKNKRKLKQKKIKKTKRPQNMRRNTKF